jgi:hypothetical protein
MKPSVSHRVSIRDSIETYPSFTGVLCRNLYWQTSKVVLPEVGKIVPNTKAIKVNKILYAVGV